MLEAFITPYPSINDVLLRQALDNKIIVDKALAEKDEEISRLKRELQQQRSNTRREVMQAVEAIQDGFNQLIPSIQRDAVKEFKNSHVISWTRAKAK